jgi:alkyl sulfatase BDS1-like metallo-beta-lactamase superfamily hydrolase
LSNGALIQTPNPRSRVDTDLSLRLTKAQLLGLMAGQGPGDIELTGDPGVLQTLLGLLDTPDPAFAIVTP